MMMMKMITSSSKKRKRKKIIIQRLRRVLLFGISTFLLFIFVYSNIITARNRIITTTTKTTTTPTTPTTTTANNSTTIIINNNNDQNNSDNIINNNQTSNSSNRSYLYWRPTKQWVDQCVKDTSTSTTSSSTTSSSSNINRPFNVKWRRYTLGDCFRFCRNCYHKDCVDHPSKTLKRHSGCYEKTSRNDTYAALYYFRSCYQYQHYQNTNTKNSQKNKLLPNGNYSRHIDGSKNWTILQDIIYSTQNKNNYSIPNNNFDNNENNENNDNNEIVIHLRLGDIIESSISNVSTMLLVGADPKHHEINSIKPISEYLNNIEEIITTTNTTNNNNNKKKKKKKRWIVTIRGGSHDPKYYKKSRIFATCLQKAIQQYLGNYYYYYYYNKNYNNNNNSSSHYYDYEYDYEYVKMNIEGNTPDEDFYYMGHAKYLIISSGGYSNMIGTFAKNNGGIIIGRTFSKHE